ncbi:MAG: NHL repeat-containing protein [Bacteroidetes bacterium]|nr:NHL repeat-containing protein [Bacteroidota bacterium]MBU1680955.1 NHL repeat-containing protein [Bacteroidota bacterium]MBU2506127.1 NHL repeat-containing protein [Bacteroidota bacterium]
MKSIIITFLLSSASLIAQNFIFVNEIGDFEEASSFSINPSGFIYVADVESNEVAKLDTLGNVNKFVGGYGWSISSFDEPVDVFANTLHVYIADKNNHRIQIFDKDLNFLSEFASSNVDREENKFAYPTSCGVSKQGDFFILDSDNSRIIKYNLNGNYILQIGSFDAGQYALNDPKKFAVSNSEKIFVAEKEKIIVFDVYANALNNFLTGIENKNINITAEHLCINSNNEIKILTLTSNSQSLISFIPENLMKNENIVEVSLFRKKLYVLTEKRILIYTRL